MPVIYIFFQVLKDEIKSQSTKENVIKIAWLLTDILAEIMIKALSRK